MKKLSPTANSTLWEINVQKATNSDFVQFGIALDPADHVFIGGMFTGTVDFGGAPMTSDRAGGSTFNVDMLLAHLAPYGRRVWSASPSMAGTLGHQRVFDITRHPAGGSVIIGDFAGSLTLGGTTCVNTDGKNEDPFVVRYVP